MITLKGYVVKDAQFRHEVMRFNTMTEKALFTRLKVIKRPEKLASFYQATVILGSKALAAAIRTKAKVMGVPLS